MATPLLPQEPGIQAPRPAATLRRPEQQVNTSDSGVTCSYPGD